MKNISFFLIFCFLSACKKEKDPTPKPVCLISRIDNSNGSYSTYEYDANKRLKSFYIYEAPEEGFSVESKNNFIIIRDQANRISKIVINNGLSLVAKTFEYDVKGRWIRSRKGPVNDASAVPLIFTLTEVEYNPEGLISKTTNFDNGSFFYSHSYEYKNGNLSKSIFETNFSNSKIIYLFGHHLDREAKPSEVDWIKVYLTNISTIAGASPAKHLIKSLTPGNSSIAWEEYTYEFNKFGYPSKIITKNNYTHNTKKSISTFTYLCE